MFKPKTKTKLISEIFKVKDKNTPIAFKYRDENHGGTMKGWQGSTVKQFEIFWDMVIRCKNGDTCLPLHKRPAILWCAVKIDNEDFFRYYHANNWGNGWRNIPLDSDYNFGGDYQAAIQEMSDIIAKYQ